MANLRIPESVYVKRFDSYADNMIHQRLSTIFRERCQSNSSRIKEFLRVPEYSEQNYIIDLLLNQRNLAFRKYYSKMQLRKLSLLWIAVLGSCHNSAELLVRSGADVNQLYGLHVKYFQLELNTKSSVLHFLLQMNPFQKSKKLIHLMTDHGADLQARDTSGQSVLHLAVKCDRAQMLEMLLEKGANLQARDSGGRTALHIAVMNTPVQMAELLLKKGANLQARDSEGRSALHIAVIKAPVQMVEFLLKKGANVNVADDKGKTPLLLAADSSKADDLVLLLMKYGADVSVQDLRGQNILHRLSRAPMERVEVARVLIEKGLSVDDRDDNQYQPIHLAAQKSNNKLVKLYLDHGADVNSLVNDDEFPLHIAALEGNTALMKTLIERGADIHKKTGTEGRTALHTVCRYPTIDQKSIRLLLSAGADVLAEDHDGNTPFAYIAWYNMAKPGSCLIVKEMALRKVCQPGIQLKDERIIERHSELRDYYRGCIEQIERMKSTRFIETCTFLELLTKRHCQIAALMRNPDFEIKFKNYDLSPFSMYDEEVLCAFERAEKHHQSRLDQEDVINEAVNHILPSLIVRRMVYYIFHCCEHLK